MHPFLFQESTTADAAVNAVALDAKAQFLAGGTTLIDLMKLDVMTPAKLVDVRALPFDQIEVSSDGIKIGANVSNSELAFHRAVRERFPVVSEALLAGASAQLRNMAMVAGNLMQRTRCPYFRDIHAHCNKRDPNSGCDAIPGYNRGHAVLGTSERCIATHPSDMCVALATTEATIHTRRQDGSERKIAMEDFHLLPGDTPEKETLLEYGELITYVFIPASPIHKRSRYLKVRDRASYDFALASAAVALEQEGDAIRTARVALGGIATKPWRSREAEKALTGRPATTETFRAAAEAALSGAKPLEYNGFKIELAKRTLILALEELAKR